MERFGSKSLRLLENRHQSDSLRCTRELSVVNAISNVDGYPNVDIAERRPTKSFKKLEGLEAFNSPDY